VYNIIKTATSGKFLAQEEAEAAPLAPNYEAHKGDHWHRVIERKPVQFAIWITIAILIGGIIEIIPTITVSSNIPTIASVKPYSALELEGRDLYIREGCNACHSQMVRPFRSEVERYGEYSKAGEFVYDHPFLWGSKRTGPDLHRIGIKYQGDAGAVWHYNHMWDPREMNKESIMPRYPWLFSLEGNDGTLNTANTEAKLKAMQTLGVPYSDEYIANWQTELEAQASMIAEGLNKNPDIDVEPNEEIIALIAYLQRLGRDIEKNEVVQK
jgi:cytochrome c oxidase cbb3-type subunit I/II